MVLVSAKYHSFLYHLFFLTLKWFAKILTKYESSCKAQNRYHYIKYLGDNKQNFLLNNGLKT